VRLSRRLLLASPWALDSFLHVTIPFHKHSQDAAVSHGALTGAKPTPRPWNLQSSQPNKSFVTIMEKKLIYLTFTPCVCVCVCVCVCLEFELWASHLLCRHSYHLSHSATLPLSSLVSLCFYVQAVHLVSSASFMLACASLLWYPAPFSKDICFAYFTYLSC
jgi:hypothetical protein